MLLFLTLAPALASGLVSAATNWANINPAQRSNASASVELRRNGAIIRIVTGDPGDHLTGLVMRTAPATRRRNLRAAGNGEQAVIGFVLDRGIYTYWRFVGSTASDSLVFGAQGHIISKRNGGVVDFGRDSARDTFTFLNKIDVARCSEKHGFPCHPLNHLQRVLIKNFGPEDVINLQGKRYRYDDVKNGALPGVPVDRLRVETIGAR